MKKRKSGGFFLERPSAAYCVKSSALKIEIGCGSEGSQTRKAIKAIKAIQVIHDRPRIHTEHARDAPPSSTTSEQTTLALVEPRRPRESRRRQRLGVLHP